MVSMSVAQKEELADPKAKKHLIEDVIARAVKKIGGRKENELCKYLPMKTGGYMHHFTFKKMKQKQPQELASIVEKHVIQPERPIIISPKQRAARGSRKRRDHMNFTKNQLDRMLNIARLAGDKEIMTILSPRKSLATCKRELIQAVRHHKIEQELWDSYVEAVNIQQATTDAILAQH
jgi:hypothetical protein